MQNNVKRLRAQVRLNLRAQGILMKRLPEQLLEKHDEDPNPRVLNTNRARVRNMKRAIKELGNMPGTIRGWASNRRINTDGNSHLRDKYLDEVVAGAVYAKNPSFFVALKAVYTPQGFRTVPVGFVSYGTFVPARASTTENGVREEYAIRFRGDGSTALNAAADNGRMADIEVVVTSPLAEGRGVGKALIEFALADIAGRMTRGSPRYTYTVLNTSAPSMAAISTFYGMKNQPWGHQPVPVGEVDDPATQKMYVLDMQQQMGALVSKTANRVIEKRLCPAQSRARNAAGTHSAFWQTCR